MKRLLCLLSSMNAGGAEGFLMKVYRNLDRNKYQMDFCINVKEKCFYEDEILAMGGKIYRIPSKSENLKEFKRGLTEIIQTNGYDYVLRITSSAMGFMDLKIAKKAGASVCCARSSNASDGGSLKALIMHTLGKILYSSYVDVAIAPSDLAAIYTFGEKKHKSGKVHILNNAVDLDVFRYDSEARKQVRSEFGIDDKIVIGHIGRISKQKNHDFLLKIFQEFKNHHPNSVLLLVGKGELEDAIKNQAHELNLSDSIIFAGIRNDIPRIFSAMDAFVFPSFYEGMPNTVIEAQACGLPCVISDTITKSAAITNLVEYVSLKNDVSDWRKATERAVLSERKDTKNDFIKQRYDIGSTVTDFVKYIMCENQQL